MPIQFGHGTKDNNNNERENMLDEEQQEAEALKRWHQMKKCHAEQLEQLQALHNKKINELLDYQNIKRDMLAIEIGYKKAKRTGE